MKRDELIAQISQRETSALSDEQRRSMLLDWWRLGPEDREWTSLPSQLQEEMQSSDEPGEPHEPRYEPLLAVGIAHRYTGVKNSYLQRKAQSLGIEVNSVEGEPETRQVCPCCHYRTLPERGGYTICNVCFWEDDGSDVPGHYSSPNHMTLLEGRENFLLHGSCSGSAASSKWIDLMPGDAYERADTDFKVRPS
ncbi:CPCC family cysteine-rich protein [Stigmatella hybrida]|uniref:CPCC family cysteine-rich protein n=1 Tax=Stigmatella hybrida TaxID=394097 RepID=UPI001CDB010B|nr:CPCC family cysteine-rich protein [Stigmatella hybrida]